MRRRWLPGVLLAVALVTGCGPAEAGSGDLARIDPAVADHPDAAVAEIAAGFDDFGFALLEALHELDEDEPNTVLSPLSAGAALSLLLAGAGGETAEEIADVLGIDDAAAADGRVGALLLALAGAGDATLTVANAVWTVPGYPLTDEYRQAVEAALGATLDELDLGDADAVAEIDRWAAERTEGLIEEITDAIDLPDPQAVAVLANATYFAGTWTTQFDPDRTAQGPFTRDDGSQVTVWLMAEDDMDLAVAADHDTGIVLARLPYGEEERFGFEVLLPPDGMPVTDALERIGADGWRRLSETATGQEDMRVVLPRFEVESEHDLVEPLRQLGIERAFGAGHDFTLMSPANPWLDAIAQKAVIEVDESGTEAAAVTAGVMVESAPMVSEVLVDRSFAFAVRDTQTGAVLFLGILDDPTA